MSGRLYMVSTPIGNLGDFSHRAAETLRSVAVIACEDTRHTRRLLQHYDIQSPTVSLHAHTSEATMEKLLSRVEAGEDVAYVTDAGTPGISDPGGLLAEKAHRRGLKVVPIPGPGAVLAALAATGFPADRFIFLGFLPRKGVAREELLTVVADSPITAVCYEAPGRTPALLRDLEGRCGPAREAAVARELTKLHEEIRRGTLDELRTYYEEHPPRGEVTIVVGARPAADSTAPVDEADTAALVAELKGTGSPTVVAKELARRLGIARQEAYRLLTSR